MIKETPGQGARPRTVDGFFPARLQGVFGGGRAAADSVEQGRGLSAGLPPAVLQAGGLGIPDAEAVPGKLLGKLWLCRRQETLCGERSCCYRLTVPVWGCR